MTRPTVAPAPRPRGAATATALLVAAGAGAWSQLLGRSLVRVAPPAALAVVVLLAAGWVSRRLAGGLLVVWVPAAVWAAGAPADQLLPQAWPGLLARLVGGAQRLTALGGGSGPIRDDPWPLAAWLLGAGVLWVAGAVLAVSRPSSARWRAIAFGVLVAPWIAAVAVRQTDQAAWQGAAILLSGLLWFADRRLALRPALVLGLVTALVSVGTAQAIGPRTRWFTPASLFSSAPPFRTLQTNSLTYGPLQGRRSGATMLEITASQPALWRMQVLDVFAEDVWGVRSWAAALELPEPAAEPAEIAVGVRGLRDDLVVAPGRINAVHTHGKASQAPGQAWQLTPAPQQGDTYQVQASVVHPTAEQLQAAPAPTDGRLLAYMDLYVRHDQATAANQPPQAPTGFWAHRPEPAAHSWHRVNVPLFGQGPDPRVTAVLDRTPYSPVAALARQLAAGATSQWDVVARVHRYLLDSGRFRYTTNLPQAGPYPLVDFLLRDRVGDCQHFAGAAALLLRLAGVPTRVVVGFATGVRQGGRFEVRDVDAHAWIEVYFQGYGWVVFNPTPAAAQAHIPRQLDPLAPAPAGPTGSHGKLGGLGGLGGLAVGVILAALATAGVWVARRRIRRGPAPLGPLLEGLVGRVGGHVRTSSTLAELSVELMRLVGPQTAALATQAERARFAPDLATPVLRPRIRIARALAEDLGPIRGVTVLIAPAVIRWASKRLQRTA
jgi:hypothetical protein